MKYQKKRGQWHFKINFDYKKLYFEIEKDVPVFTISKQNFGISIIFLLFNCSRFLGISKQIFCITTMIMMFSPAGMLNIIATIAPLLILNAIPALAL